MCTVKANERYPEGCRGWTVEREDGCYKCANCKYATKAPTHESILSKHPKSSTSEKTLFDTWSRQFVFTTVEERL